MKTPLTYYGGKQQLTSELLHLIPKHYTYCEPFFGGGALFFAKEPSAFEVVNDTNRNLVTFYQTIQADFEALQHEIQQTLHSRTLHRDAMVVYDHPHLFSHTKVAWAVWVLANQSYCSKLNGSFGYDRNGSTTKRTSNKRTLFGFSLEQRLEQVLIESRDALVVINAYDDMTTFHYLDPPYVGTDQGHYDGYTQADFDALIHTLANIKGKFLLSSFRNETLTQLSQEKKWYTFEIRMRKSANARYRSTAKIEVLTANYPITAETLEDLPLHIP